MSPNTNPNDGENSPMTDENEDDVNWPVIVYTIRFKDKRTEDMQCHMTDDPEEAEEQARRGALVTSDVYTPTDMPDHSDPYSKEHLDRVLLEVLEDPEYYVAGAGPEGPWFWKSLKIKREMNTIYVYDVDGQPAAQLAVPDMSEERYTDTPRKALRSALNEINRDTLNEL